MKILFNCTVPFALAHGGQAIQIQQTMAALQGVGMTVEPLRWADENQTGDLIHCFGSTSNSFLNLARTAKMPVVMTSLFSETCNRSPARLARQGWLIQTVLKTPVARQVKSQLNWTTYNNATHNIVGLECEKRVLQTVYRVPAERISVVPLGLPENFLHAGTGQRREQHLLCLGTIYAVKNSIELARMARAAEVPILFVGKPYHPDAPYWRRFQELIDGRWVKHQPHIQSEVEVIALLQAARGFVLMSHFENWSLAAHEAVACGLPVLVQDQNWSHECFGDQARYFKTIGYTDENVRRLKQFYADAPRLVTPDIKLHSWIEIAQVLKKTYEKVLALPK